MQHALRAFTARDQQALKKAAQTYRPNLRFDIAESIRDVGVGEAITSFLQGKGEPSIAERTLIRPPGSGVRPLDASARTTIMARSPVAGKYDQMVDSDSAHEMLARRAEAATSAAQAKLAGSEATQTQDASGKPSGGGSGDSSRRGDSVIEAFFKSFAQQLGTRSGRALIRGIFGSLMKGR